VAWEPSNKIMLFLSLSSAPLPEGRKGTAWDLHNRQLSSYPPLLNVMSHTTTHFLFSLSLSLSLSLGFKESNA
jgi:hypothetical protein